MRRTTLTTALLGLMFAVGGFAAMAAVLQQQERVTANLTATLHDEARAELAEQTRLALLSLNTRDRDFVQSSRATFVAAGFTPAYLDGHLFLVNVAPKEDGALVQWRFSDGDRNIALIDDVTLSGSVYTHTMKEQLGVAHDLVHVLPASQADRLLRRCIGSFEGSVVRLAAPTVGSEAVFALIARSTDGTTVGSLNLETGECSQGSLD